MQILTRNIPETLSSGSLEDCTTEPSKTSTSLGVMADLPNTQRQTQKGKQNGQTKKSAPNERTRKIPKELNEMEATKIPDADLKMMVIRMLKDFRGRMYDLKT